MYESALVTTKISALAQFTSCKHLLGISGKLCHIIRIRFLHVVLLFGGIESSCNSMCIPGILLMRSICRIETCYKVGFYVH